LTSCNPEGIFAATAALNWAKITETKKWTKEDEGISLSQNVNGMWSQWKDLAKNVSVMRACGFNSAYWMAIAGGQMTIMPLLLTGEHFGLNPMELGSCYAYMSAITVVGSQPAAYVVDHIGANRAILPGAVLTAAGLFAMPLTHGYLDLGAALTSLALGSTILGTAPTAHVSNVVVPGERAQALALLRTSGDVGLLLGASSAGALADWSSMEMAMESSAGVLAAATMWFGVRMLGGPKPSSKLA